MKIFSSVLAAVTLLSGSALAQVPVVVGPNNIKIDKVSPAVLTTPEFMVRGTTDKRAEYLKWLEIEVEFEVNGVELVDELTFKYLVELNGKLYTGDVTHVNIPKGKGRYSVMYISPRSIERITGGKPLNQGMIGNMWVTVEKQGQRLAVGALQQKAPPNAAQIPGMLVPKSETPFQALWWDRYEAVKVPGRSF